MGCPPPPPSSEGAAGPSFFISELRLEWIILWKNCRTYLTPLTGRRAAIRRVALAGGYKKQREVFIFNHNLSRTWGELAPSLEIIDNVFGRLSRRRCWWRELAAGGVSVASRGAIVTSLSVPRAPAAAAGLVTSRVMFQQPGSVVSYNYHSSRNSFRPSCLPQTRHLCVNAASITEFNWLQNQIRIVQSSN